MNNVKYDSRIIVAMDFNDLEKAKALAEKLSPELCKLKVGKELFTTSGPKAVELFQRMGFDVFLDLKFHDIPNTVKSACQSAAQLGVWMMNVHASGGPKMMEAAKEGVQNISKETKLIAVTVLTSLNQREIDQIGLKGEASLWVNHWADLALNICQLDGLVCSARESNILRAQFGQKPLLVTPGIRTSGQLVKRDDQQRTMDPISAVEAGSDYLVIGRPVTQADDASRALEFIAHELNQNKLLYRNHYSETH